MLKLSNGLIVTKISEDYVWYTYEGHLDDVSHTALNQALVDGYDMEDYMWDWHINTTYED